MANIPFDSELYQNQLVDPHVWNREQVTPPVVSDISGYAPPLQSDEFGCKWRGAAAPFGLRKDGRLGSKCTNEIVKSSIMMIYTTRIGSRLMQPLFGSHFLDILYEPNDLVLRAESVYYMTSAIKRWEPRINLFSLDVYTKDGGILVHHNYQLRESGRQVSMYLQAQKANVGSLRIVDNVG